MEMILKAMFWAVFDEKAAVVSMSLGFDLPGNTARLIAKGVPPALASNATIRQHSDSSRALSTLRPSWNRGLRTSCLQPPAETGKRPGFVLDAAFLRRSSAVGAVGLETGKWRG
jgi:hypothetical protein